MNARWAVGFAMLATVLVHGSLIGGEFLFYDDARFVVRNESIDDLSNFGRYFTDLGTTAPPQGLYLLSVLYEEPLFAEPDAGPAGAPGVFPMARP